MGNSKRAPTSILTFHIKNQEFLPKRKTIVVLNGGPGGSLVPYRSMDGILNLSDNYNLLFYDQRGVGRSSTVTSTNINSVKLENYHTENNVADLKILIDQVVGEKVILLGHSYGAHLAYAFGVKYPEKVSRLISLNGGLDSMGFVLQAHKKNEALSSALAGIPESKLNTLVVLLQQNKIKNRNGEIFGFQNFMLTLLGQISSFKGQKSEAAKFVNKIIEINQEEIDQANSELNVEAVNTIRFDSDPGEYINMFINPNILCHEFIIEATLEGFSQTVIDASRQYIAQACAPTQRQDGLKVFDKKSQIKQLTFPILTIGGTHDPLVPLEVQERDFSLLSAGRTGVSLVVLSDTGHQVFDESPKCLNKAINSFLQSDNSIESTRTECTESQQP